MPLPCIASIIYITAPLISRAITFSTKENEERVVQQPKSMPFLANVKMTPKELKRKFLSHSVGACLWFLFLFFLMEHSL